MNRGIIADIMLVMSVEPVCAGTYGAGDWKTIGELLCVTLGAVYAIVLTLPFAYLPFGSPSANSQRYLELITWYGMCYGLELLTSGLLCARRRTHAVNWRPSDRA